MGRTDSAEIGDDRNVFRRFCADMCGKSRFSHTSSALDDQKLVFPGYKFLECLFQTGNREISICLFSDIA